MEWWASRPGIATASLSGLLLLAQGWITHSELQHALAIQRERGGRIGEVLVAECGVEPDKIIRGLSLQWSCPVLETSAFSPRAMALVLPRVFMEQFGMLPVRVAGSRILYLGFEDRLDAATALSLEQMVGLKVESGLVRTQEYESAREALLKCETVPLREEFCEETDTMASRVTAILEQEEAADSFEDRPDPRLLCATSLAGAEIHGVTGNSAAERGRYARLCLYREPSDQPVDTG